MVDRPSGDAFGLLSGQFWSTVLQCGARLLDRAVSGARFLTGGVFECDIAHRRSVAVIFMFYKIGCNPMRPLNCAIPGPYVPVGVTRGSLVAHRYTYAPPRCILLTPYTMVGLAGFKSKANASLLA